MHTIVIKRKVYDQHPWIAQSLFDAFDAAKRRAMENLYETNALAVAAPFIVHDIERTRQLMGMDYWPFGIEPNMKSITTFIRHLGDQQIIERAPEVEELFLDVKPSVRAFRTMAAT
jgi:4,5-dihydroxyphthalate decarboxylase